MKALVWTPSDKLEYLDVEEPQIQKPNEVKVKIYGTGICGTDLNVLKGKMYAAHNMIMGHESAGVVVETGEDVKNVKPGDRVVIDPTQYCGKCYYCRKGLTCYCETFEDWQLGIGAHGTFAEYYVGEDRFMYKIPDAMEWERAVLIEPLSCVLHVMEKAAIKPDDSVLVLGSGPIGLLVQMMAKKTARLTVATEIGSFRAEAARALSDHVYHPDELNLEEVFRINQGRKFDVIFDAIGNQLEWAYPLAEKGGRLVPMGFDDTYEMKIKPYQLLSGGVTIVGTGEARQTMESALSCASDMPRLKELITEKTALENFEQAIDNLMGIDPITKERKDITAIKTILVTDPDMM
ncbi:MULTISPECIES: zinc-dependent alcohol dehydrogenase [Bacillus]|uniref:zinc-dependent alcohol dehydrogenase n=1 Tax=Bacillus TaxID=1386 RepID=UPI0015822D51|nr:alcohol dehydrogenase catalytic domain-containing protein [Bacillus glycinifermentans]MBU8785888.1 alcohol dehydrogenase catalytic domain-containing protein [Bacillus glycinifermentans]NUJ15576.1 zinc-binding dehydrogenase [Bacillus glycinifermentans]